MATKERTREPQYQITVDNLQKMGPVTLGYTASHLWRTDPRHLAFLLSRYKFVSKMFTGRKSVMEVGCGEGFGMKVVLQEVPHVHGVDFDPVYTRWGEEQAKREGLNCTFASVDLTKEVPPGTFDGAYSLDVIEHIPQAQERAFIGNIARALAPHAACIIGTPNITAHAYASPPSREGHINLKSHET